MIVFDLACPEGHPSEGWFASSEAFSDQLARGLVTCPQCGSRDIAKAPMAPAVPIKGNARAPSGRAVRPVTGDLPPEVIRAMHALANAQTIALKNSTWVGDRFAEESRAIHYGERDQAVIHGEATRDQAVALVEEGIAVSPLPFPVRRPEDVN